MDTQIKEQLDKTIKDVALAAINPDTVKEILQKEMQSAIRDVASDLYSGYRSEFKETIKNHVIEQVKINVGAIQLTDLNKATLDLIKNEFNQIEIENKERVLQETLQAIREITIPNKEANVKDIQDAFTKYVIAKHADDMDAGYDYCNCDSYDVKKFEDIDTYKELVEELNEREQDEEYEIETELHEQEWGTYGTYYTTHLNIYFLQNNTKIEELSLHISPIDRFGIDDKSYKGLETKKYELISIDFSGGPIVEDGKIPTNRLDPVKKFLASIYLNKLPIHIPSLDGIEYTLE